MIHLLRRLSENSTLIESAIFGVNFNMVTRAGLPLILEHQDGNLHINSLALNKCFSYKHVLQRGSKMASNLANTISLNENRQ